MELYNFKNCNASQFNRVHTYTRTTQDTGGMSTDAISQDREYIQSPQNMGQKLHNLLPQRIQLQTTRTKLKIELKTLID